MAFQEIGADDSTEFVKDELLIESEKAIDKTDKQLLTMWEHYVQEHSYNNPVTLVEFFKAFTAVFGYFYTIVNRYKFAIDSAVSAKTSDIYKNYQTKSVTDRDGVIRRAERSMRAKSEYYLSEVAWAKGCVNEMQTLIRTYGDDAKMMGGNA